jgi:hypothetical protein
VSTVELQNLNFNNNGHDEVLSVLKNIKNFDKENDDANGGYAKSKS